MELKNFAYLFLLVGTVIIPLALSFKKPIRFYSKLKYLFPAIIFTGAIFIMWDMSFEERAIWRFNPEFLLGINILNLPVEEWLFFIAIPYSSIFVYETIKYSFSSFEKPNVFLALSLILFLFFGIIAYTSRQKLYPFFTFFLLAIYLGYTIFRNRFKRNYTKFYLAYFVLLIPYAILSGILTSLPIINYNPAHVFGILLFTIPIENFAYFFLLLLMNITIYEYLAERRYY